MSTKNQDCPRCDNTTRLEKRPFSDQAMAALIVWGDVEKSLVGQSICDECYTELRDILIERGEEIKTVDPNLLHRAG